MMHTHADKNPENVTPTQRQERESVVSTSATKSDDNSETVNFTSNHPDVIAQRKLQQMANNSTQVKQLNAIQEMANNRYQAQRAIPSLPEVHNATTIKSKSIQKKENKTGLPDQLKTGIESLSGHSMDDVKVNYNSDKPTQFQAHAFAQGTEIHIATGQEKHLPHEAWHVVQQKQRRVQPTLQMEGNININDDLALEHEADTMGARASQMKSKTVVNTISASSRMEKDSHTSNGSVIQAFGIDDRNWKSVTKVKSLKGSGGVYLLMANAEGVVVKSGGIDNNAVKEALASEIGNIEALGINTIKTIPLLTNSPEVTKQLLPTLKKLNIKAFMELGGEEMIIVMPFIEGTSVRDAGPLFQQVAPSQRHSWYYSMGRLWAFDVFISNSDRYLTGTNMGNIMISNEGVIYGIDQALGRSATSEGGIHGEAKAIQRLEDIMDGGARLTFCKEIYSNINGDLKGHDLNDEKAFCIFFEKGILAALPGIGSISMMQVMAAKAQLPGAVQGVAQEIGLGGMPGIMKAFGTTIMGVRSRPIPIPNAVPRERKTTEPTEEKQSKSKQVRSKYYSKLGILPQQREEEDDDNDTQFHMEL
jgi:hypothetical protein